MQHTDGAITTGTDPTGDPAADEQCGTGRQHPGDRRREDHGAGMGLAIDQQQADAEPRLGKDDIERHSGGEADEHRRPRETRGGDVGDDGEGTGISE